MEKFEISIQTPETLANLVRDDLKDKEYAKLSKRLKAMIPTVREEVYGLLNDLEPEELAISKFLQRINIPAALETAQDLYYVSPEKGDAPLPSEQMVLVAIMNTMTPENILRLEKFRDPQISITPITSFARHQEFFRESSHGQEPFFSERFKKMIEDKARKAGVKGDEIKEWTLEIIEAQGTVVIPGP